MSVVDFKKYGQMIAEDEKVRAKAKEIGISDPDGQIAYAKTLGLEFTVNDMEDLVKEAGVSKDELSEEDLEKVAGGVFSTIAAVIGVVGAVAGVAGLAVSGAGIASSVATTASRDW
jgi:predicted ribosomally synthesized peptide with nif11-like leader